MSQKEKEHGEKEKLLDESDQMAYEIEKQIIESEKLKASLLSEKKKELNRFQQI